MNTISISFLVFNISNKTSLSQEQHLYKILIQHKRPSLYLPSLINFPFKLHSVHKQCQQGKDTQQSLPTAAGRCQQRQPRSHSAWHGLIGRCHLWKSSVNWIYTGRLFTHTCTQSFISLSFSLSNSILRETLPPSLCKVIIWPQEAEDSDKALA